VGFIFFIFILKFEIGLILNDFVIISLTYKSEEQSTYNIEQGKVPFIQTKHTGKMNK